MKAPHLVGKGPHKRLQYKKANLILKNHNDKVVVHWYLLFLSITVNLRLPNGIPYAPESSYDEKHVRLFPIRCPSQHHYNHGDVDYRSKDEDRHPSCIFDNWAEAHWSDCVNHSIADQNIAYLFDTPCTVYVSLKLVYNYAIFKLKINVGYYENKLNSQQYIPHRRNLAPFQTKSLMESSKSDKASSCAWMLQWIKLFQSA